MGTYIAVDWLGGGRFTDIGDFYTALVQAVLLCRSESWVMSLQIGKVLGGFRHQLIQRLLE